MQKMVVAGVALFSPPQIERCPMGSVGALDRALITARAARDKRLLKKLDAVAGRVLKAKGKG
jgi:5'-methylthioadenosine phosphorylase